MKERKLKYCFHNSNSAEDTANYLFKILIEANVGKVERAIEEAAFGIETERNSMNRRVEIYEHSSILPSFHR